MKVDLTDVTMDMAIDIPIIVARWPHRGPTGENWGDKLNRDLIYGLSRLPVVNVNDVQGWGDRPVYRVIGSGLGKMRSNEIVWGSGFIDAHSVPVERAASLCAVRGPLSYARLHDLGIDCPEVFGDPAVLYPLLYWPEIEVTHDYGVIQHHREIGVVEPVRPPDGRTVRYIDIRGSLKGVVDEILGCRAIVSSSLHGVICAHAYGIPACWLNASELPLGDGFKFRDYFASIGHAKIEPATMAPGEVFAPGWSPDYPVPGCFDAVALLKGCPFLSDERQEALLRRRTMLTAKGKRGTIFH